LIAVIQEVPRVEEGTSLSVLNLSTTIVPGMAVLFVFLAAQTAAKGIFEERRAGSLRRLLAAPLRRWEVLAGKMLPILILIAIQIGFIFAAGALILPVLGLGRLGAGSNVLAWLIASLVIALCSACLGILIASIAKSEGQITGLSNAILWIAGFLGGAIIPAFFLQSIPMLNILSRFVPHYWATSAYYDILARGKGLVEVMPSLAVLLIFSAGFFILGVRRFRFE
jgi:ABC-2 type transport system permease protein